MSHELNKIIDQTMLRPNATKNELEQFCMEAIQYNFVCVALLPNVIKEAYSILKGTEVHIMAAISYPRGMVPKDLKVKEIDEALNDGANEIDMVLNLDAIKCGNYDLIEKEISALREATLSLTAKAILETTLLNDEEIIRVCRIASEIGIDYVKTSTGFNGNQATIHAVQLMKKSVFNKTKVKAAGGINKLDKVVQMLKAGARRIGTSAGPAIMEEYKIKKIDFNHIMTD